MARCERWLRGPRLERCRLSLTTLGNAIARIPSRSRFRRVLLGSASERSWLTRSVRCSWRAGARGFRLHGVFPALSGLEIVRCSPAKLGNKRRIYNCHGELDATSIAMCGDAKPWQIEWAVVHVGTPSIIHDSKWRSDFVIATHGRRNFANAPTTGRVDARIAWHCSRMADVHADCCCTCHASSHRLGRLLRRSGLLRRIVRGGVRRRDLHRGCHRCLS